MKRELELLCPPAARPAAPVARTPLELQETDPRSLEGFDEELAHASGTEYGQP